jgi:hypothetical protein
MVLLLFAKQVTIIQRESIKSIGQVFFCTPAGAAFSWINSYPYCLAPYYLFLYLPVFLT